MVQTLPLPHPLSPCPSRTDFIYLGGAEAHPHLRAFARATPSGMPPRRCSRLPPNVPPSSQVASPRTRLFLTIAAKDAPLQPTPYPSLFDFVRSIYLHLSLFYSHCVHSPPPTPPEESGSDLVTAVPSASRTGPDTLVVTRIFIDYLTEDRSNVV